MNPIPFKPESLASMKARFNTEVYAINYSAELIRIGAMIPPGRIPMNVYDFVGGIRMVASVDLDGLRRFLHFTFYVHRDSPESSRVQLSGEDLARVARDLVKEFGITVDPTWDETSRYAHHLYYLLAMQADPKTV